MAKHSPVKFGSIRLSKLSNKCENEPSFQKNVHKYVWFDKYLEQSHTRKKENNKLKENNKTKQQRIISFWHLHSVTEL